MTKRISDKEKSLFLNSVKGTKKIKQDTVITNKKKSYKEKEDKRLHASFGLKSEYQYYHTDSTLSFLRDGYHKKKLKQLKLGWYEPEIDLDLHAYTLAKAKYELNQFIQYCIKKQFDCACVIHGKGTHTLKNHIPHWLIQYQNIIAFHEAPQHLGGSGALLILFAYMD